MKLLHSALLTTILFSSISYALPEVGVSSTISCNPATQACLYVSTHIQDVPSASYLINARLTLAKDGQKQTVPVSSSYDNPTDYLWMTISGVVDSWTIDFTGFTINSAGVITNVPNISQCQALSIPTSLGNHFLQINGTKQWISCSVA